MWYLDKVYEQCNGRLVSPATIQLAEHVLESIRLQRKGQEPMNTYWDIRFKAIVSTENAINVCLANENDVLVVDFDAT